MGEVNSHWVNSYWVISHWYVVWSILEGKV